MGRSGESARTGGLGEMLEIPAIDHATVLEAVPPESALEQVREGFVRYAQGRWSMPPKVYLQSPPSGDFRAMPALGDGIAVLKWVTSFPSNSKVGLPTVTGIILVNDATTGQPVAVVDARAVTALRTGAAAAVAAQALAAPGAETVGLIGCGLHGAWAARCLSAAGYGPGVCTDPDASAARRLAAGLAWRDGTREEALACDIVTTVTPGYESVVASNDLRPGLHLNALGADGPGKAELEVEALVRCQLFCDDWGQASHGGELTGALEQGLVTREDVTELGDVLTGKAPGRTSPDAITLFDSTGLAIQDLAVTRLLVQELRAGRLETSSVLL